MLSVVSELVVIVFSVLNARWVHRLYSDVPRLANLLSGRDVFVCRTCRGHNCSVKEKLGFKMCEVQGVMWCVSWEAGFIF